MPTRVFKDEMNAKQMMVDRLLNGEHIIDYREGGNSMVPIIHSRDPVCFAPVEVDKIEKGDVVFARVDGRYITSHKVSSVDKQNRRVQISNNHGHINGWASFDKVYGIVYKINGREIPGAKGKIK